MAFKVRNWAPIAVGMGDTPSMWSYSGPLGDSLGDIKANGYFNKLSDDLQNADFKTGDFIQVVTFNDDFALLVMGVGVTDISTVQIAPHDLPFSFNLVQITDGIVPTQAQNGFIFHTNTAALTVDLEDSSQISNGTYYRFINASTGILTIDPFGSQTIDGISAPRVLQPNQSLTITNGITSGGWDTVSDGNIASGAGSGTVTSVAATQPARGITITGSPITTAGVLTFALANDLNALENITGTAFAVRTAAEVWTTREITGIVGQISVKDGDGIAANPSISIDPTWIGQGAITTVGTITSGTWTGDTIAIANGGTGQTTAQLAINALTDSASATIGHVLTVNAGNAAVFTALPLTSEGHVWMSGNVTVTPIVTQGVAVKILGTTAGNELSADFTALNNRLTYTGTETKKFRYCSEICGSSTSNNLTFKIQLYKNGVLFSPGTGCADWQNAGRLNEVSISGLISLATNDYVEIWISNEDGTQDSTVDTLSMSLSS